MRLGGECVVWFDLVRVKIRLGVVLNAVVSTELFQQNRVGVEWCTGHDGEILESNGTSV
jgi:hypothetical protein